ncbi:hypothetical protein [Aquabacterium sp.]|uniref:hypothetical protein n=1 Tax=Aquabacterium sp. TaxID=1872578 RepID=UPI002487638E|nr:hypothetical protein [Aquabacterium sp.]MDI1259361.1 hypothetical protein [Aquabacterium sp.]
MAAPRLLVFLLATVVIARVAIVFVVGSPLATALAWSALLGGLSVAALLRKRAAAQALAWLCIVLGADALIQLLRADVSGVHLVAALLWASLVIGVGTYILRSATIQRFYAAAK